MNLDEVILHSTNQKPPNDVATLPLNDGSSDENKRIAEDVDQDSGIGAPALRPLSAIPSHIRQQVLSLLSFGSKQGFCFSISKHWMHTK